MHPDHLAAGRLAQGGVSHWGKGLIWLHTTAHLLQGARDDLMSCSRRVYGDCRQTVGQEGVLGGSARADQHTMKSI